MRLATVDTPEGPRLHVRGPDGYVDVAQATGEAGLVDLAGLLGAGADRWDLVRRAAEQPGRPVDESELGPAIPRPRRILCLGVNYADHAAEGGRPPTTWPEVFVRGADSVAPPYGKLVKPALSERFDYEGELAVVIGQRRPLHPGVRRDRRGRGVRGVHGRHRARMAARGHPVDRGQELRQVDADRPRGRDARRGRRLRRSAHDPAQRRGDAVRANVADDLRRPAHDRVPVVVHDAQTRGRDRDRNPRRRRLRPPATGLAPARATCSRSTVEGVGRIAQSAWSPRNRRRRGWPWNPPVKTGATL